MEKSNVREAQLLDGAGHVIYTAKRPRKNAAELEQVLRDNIPKHYRLVRVDSKHRGDVILRFHLKAFCRKPRTKKPAPVQAVTQAQEPAIHIPRGQMRERTAVLTLPNGQRREATPDLTTTTHAVKHRQWFNETFAAELAEYPDHKPQVKVKVNGHIALEGVLVAPKAIVLQPRNVATRPARRKFEPAQRSPLVTKHEPQATPKPKVAKAPVQKKTPTHIGPKTRSPAKTVAPKPKAPYHQPQPRQHNTATPATFEWPVIFVFLEMQLTLTGEIDERKIPIPRFVLPGEVTTLNTWQRSLKEAVRPKLLGHGLHPNRVLAHHPLRYENKQQGGEKLSALLVLLSPEDRAKLQENVTVLDAKQLEAVIPSLSTDKGSELHELVTEVMYREGMLTRPGHTTIHHSNATSQPPPGIDWQVVFCLGGRNKGDAPSFLIAGTATTKDTRSASLREAASLPLQTHGLTSYQVQAYLPIRERKQNLLLVIIPAALGQNWPLMDLATAQQKLPVLKPQKRQANLQAVTDSYAVTAKVPATTLRVVFGLCQDGTLSRFRIGTEATLEVVCRTSCKDLAQTALAALGVTPTAMLGHRYINGTENLLLVLLPAHAGQGWRPLTRATALQRHPALATVSQEEVQRIISRAERSPQHPPAEGQSATL